MQRAAAEQLPLAFDHAAATGREDLAVSERLAAAVSLIDSWPHWPAPVVVLTGPPGSGKSHLAEIFRAQAGAVDIDAMAGSHSADRASQTPVIIEDADRKGFDEIEFFHVINNVKQYGTGLLVTARSFPPSWNVQLPDLKSRLKAAMVIEIGPPDEQLLGQVIVKLFADRQLYIDDKIVSYMVQRMERSFSTAQDVVDQIDRLALARRTKITRALVSEVLAALVGRERQE